MTPMDDPTWPKCGIHPETGVTGDPGVKHWCDWTRQVLVDNGDAESLKFEGSVAVPIVPQHDLYAQVTLGDEIIPGLSYMLKLVVPKDDQPFVMPDDEELVDLGLYTRGEGRLVIATSINDWASAYDGYCRATSHGFPEEMLVQGAQNTNDMTTLKAIRWCIAYYKRCFFCYIKSQQNTGAGPAPDWNASNFGLDPNMGSRGGSRPPANARQNRARQALQNRYGNRVMAGQDPTPLGNNNWPAAHPGEAGYF